MELTGARERGLDGSKNGEGEACYRSNACEWQISIPSFVAWSVAVDAEQSFRLSLEERIKTCSSAQ